MKIKSMKKVGMLVCAGLIPLSIPQYGYSNSVEKEKPASFYLGANYGGFKSRGDEFDDDNDLVEGVVGVFISPYFAIEGAYTYFGEFGGDLVSATLDGWSAAAVGRLPLTDTFALYIKGGYFLWDADISAGPFDASVDGEEPFYGVGVDFAVADHVNLSVEYDRYKFDLSDSSLPNAIDDYKTDIDTIKVGAKFLF
jgi:OOP family OmpA-OmpF porin